jgi:hypothetical protein
MSVDTKSHNWIFPEADTGCIAIADISGYTRYLGATELEHAQDVLADLIRTVASGLRQVLHISHLEGDAVLAYALDEEIEASMLLDTIEETYFSFRSRRRDITHSTVCDCNACARIPQLDLKFISHHGQFVRTALEGSVELTGNDVIVAHSLLKNQVEERFGTDAYLLVTEPCVAALGLDTEALSMDPHEESSEAVGTVRGYVTDLDERWRYEQERRRVFVVPSQAEFEIVEELPASPSLAWEHVTSPRKRVAWQGGVDRVDQENPGGRQGIGTTNHCAHGSSTLLEEVLDWRPFQYLTKRMIGPRLLVSWVWTIEFRPIGESSSQVRVRGEKLSGLHRAAYGLLFRRRIEAQIAEDLARLRVLLQTPHPSNTESASR